MNVARPIGDVKKMAGFGYMGGEGEIRFGTPFNGIIALERPTGIAFCADDGTIQIDGNLREAQRCQPFDHHLRIEFTQGFERIGGKLLQGG